MSLMTEYIHALHNKKTEQLPQNYSVFGIFYEVDLDANVEKG